MGAGAVNNSLPLSADDDLAMPDQYLEHTAKGLNWRRRPSLVVDQYLIMQIFHWPCVRYRSSSTENVAPNVMKTQSNSSKAVKSIEVNTQSITYEPQLFIIIAFSFGPPRRLLLSYWKSASENVLCICVMATRIHRTRLNRHWYGPPFSPKTKMEQRGE